MDYSWSTLHAISSPRIKYSGQHFLFYHHNCLPASFSSFYCISSACFSISVVVCSLKYFACDVSVLWFDCDYFFCFYLIVIYQQLLLLRLRHSCTYDENKPIDYLRMLLGLSCARSVAVLFTETCSPKKPPKKIPGRFAHMATAVATGAALVYVWRKMNWTANICDYFCRLPVQKCMD